MMMVQENVEINSSTITNIVNAIYCSQYISQWIRTWHYIPYVHHWKSRGWNEIWQRNITVTKRNI